VEHGEPGRALRFFREWHDLRSLCGAVEKVLNRLPGVEATVNFATGKARVMALPDAPPAADMVAAIRKAGFDVPPGALDLTLAGMSCAACAARIEKVLNRLPSVEASVNFAAETARVRYTPGVVDPAAIVAAVVKAGFTATVVRRRPGGRGKARKASEAAAELRLFWIAAALSLPLPGADGRHARRRRRAQIRMTIVLPRWLQCLLATPVQFWIGRRFYVAWSSMPSGGGGQHGRAGGPRHQRGLFLQSSRWCS
jgi:Cu+-exporting ATPase